MTSIFPYLLEASLILLLLYAFYFLALRQKASPLLNRCYLLLSLVFALIVPVLSIPLSLGGDEGNSLILQPASKAWNLLPELVISGGSKPETAVAKTSEISWLQYIWYLYLVGFFFSLLFTVGRLWKLSSLIRQYPFHHTDTREYKVASTNGKLPTFSFLHYIFWDDTAPLSEDEAKLVLRHEEAHVRQCHSIDNIVLELLGALLWFNPVIYAYRHSLRQVHEHLADRYALGEAGSEPYFSLLVKQTLRQENLPLASQFFQHNTLNRIRMLQTKSNRTLLRATIGACIFGIIFFIAACEDNTLNEKEIKVNNEESTKVADNKNAPKVIFDVEKLKEDEIKEGDPIKIRYDENFIQYIIGKNRYTISDFRDEETKNKVWKAFMGASEEKLGKSGENILSILRDAVGSGIQPGPNVIQESEKRANSKRNLRSMDKYGNRIFEIVEEMPVPVGGKEAFYQQLSSSINYPEQAKAKGVEGRVFVQFVVETDGSISELKVVKGVGAGLDEAAIEAMKNTRWNPGKQKGREVPVRLVMPVFFKL